MTDDTPQHIKDLQLKIWLSKPPGERLLQAEKDKEAMFVFWREARKQLTQNDTSLQLTQP